MRPLICWLATILLCSPWAMAETAPATSHTARMFAQASTTSTSSSQDFQRFLKEVEQEAREKGISEKTIQKYLQPIQAPQHSSIHLVHHQAQKERTFAEYATPFLQGGLVKQGRLLMKKYQTTLNKVSDTYGVSPGIIVAIWGIESHYGQNTGSSPLIQSLVTLSYQKHRSDFYRNDLFHALEMLDKNYHIPQQIISTPDGGMGQPSFQPTAYYNYAVDFDGDGFKNIWTSEADTFASIANFLKQQGWIPQQTWGIPVTLSRPIPLSSTGLDHPRTAAQWHAQGVQWSASENTLLPKADQDTWLLFPDPEHSKRAFLLFHNFKTLMHWNPTTFESLTIGLLSDTLSHVRQP